MAGVVDVVVGSRSADRPISENRRPLASLKLGVGTQTIERYASSVKLNPMDKIDLASRRCILDEARKMSVGPRFL
jgi:hypothetical protein